MIHGTFNVKYVNVLFNENISSAYFRFSQSSKSTTSMTRNIYTQTAAENNTAAADTVAGTILKHGVSYIRGRMQ